MDLKIKYDQLETYNKQAELGGGKERIEKQHAAGKKKQPAKEYYNSSIRGHLRKLTN